MPSGRFKAAVAVLGALVISEPDFAAKNWPDFVDHYIEQVRKTIDAAEMDGYLAVVKNPNGALLLERPPNEVASLISSDDQSTLMFASRMMRA